MTGKKPLDLKIFGRQTQFYPSGYLVPTEMTDGRVLDVTYPTDTADRKSRQKRLTDAELAAEAYRQNIRAIGECGGADISVDERGQYRVVPSDFFVFGPMRREIWQSNTVIRFASLPHYDE